MFERMKAHVRGLTPGQARVLVAMRGGAPRDAWGLSARVSTLYELEALGLIVKGRRGWLDAALTANGVALRAELLSGAARREAAE